MSKPNISAFITIVTNMVNELNTTFPEHSHLWKEWNSTTLDELSHKAYIKKTDELYAFCKTVCSTQFHYIVCQDVELFAEPGRATFLPGVDFADLFYCKGISDHTQSALWNYIKLIAITVSKDGDDEDVELQDKINDIASELESMFSAAATGDIDTAVPAASADPADPPVDVMNGKLGALARDVAEEIGGEFADIIGSDLNAPGTTITDVMQRLMRNPGKLTSLVQSVSSKLTDKMGKGDITNDELMREAAQFMGGLNAPDLANGLSGSSFQDIMKTVSKAMAGMQGMPGASGTVPPRPTTDMATRDTTENTWTSKVKKRAANKKAMAALTASIPPPAPAAPLSPADTAALDDILVAALADSVGPAHKRNKKRT